jgi:hypothetical protein
MTTISTPLEPVMRERMIRLFEAMIRLTGKTPGTISIKIVGSHFRLLDTLRDPNAAFAAFLYDRVVATISAAWPDDREPWPADIPRFGLADLRVRTRSSAASSVPASNAA